MTIDLATSLEEELRHLAGLWGKDVDTLVQEAVRQYLDAAMITDVSADDVAVTQAFLLNELSHIPAWQDEPEPAADERAEAWWAELPPPVRSRPEVILTRNAVVDTIESLVVGLVTRTIRGLKTEVPLGRREGMPCPCVVNLDNILTVPRVRLKRRMGALSQEKSTELNRAITHALGISE